MLSVVEKAAALRIINGILKTHSGSSIFSFTDEDILANVSLLHSSPKLTGYSTNILTKNSRYGNSIAHIPPPLFFCFEYKYSPHRTTQLSNTEHTHRKPGHRHRSARTRMRYLIVKSSSMMKVTTYHPFFAEEMEAPERDGW